MENLNFHKRKLYALILAAAALLGLILPWFSSGSGFWSYAINGFHSWGLLVLAGVLGIEATCLYGNTQSDFDESKRRFTLYCFVVITAGAVITFIRALTEGASLGIFGIGFYLSLAAGVLGTLWILGRVKLPDIKKDDPTSPNNPPSNF